MRPSQLRCLHSIGLDRFRRSALVLTVVALAVTSSARAATPAEALPNRYRVTVPDDAAVANIEADLWIPTPMVSLFNVMSVDGLPNGQADLIRDLVARDAAGKPLALKALPEGDWELPATAAPGRVHLSYTVRLEHDRYTWPAGAEEISYRTDEGLMATGYTLFLVPTERTESPIEVDFALPAGWQARTPWAAAGPASGGGAPRTFRLKSRRELISNALFLGTAHAETVTLGGVELTLVLGKRYVPTRALFVDLLSRQLETYKAIFGGPPLAARYLIVVNQGATGDGGAWEGSFSQYVKGDADPLGRVIWGHVMAHELLHFWNGLSIVPRDSREEWFKEGVTDYLTIVSEAKNGIMDREVTLNRLANVNRRFVFARLLQGMETTVRAAGETKRENRLLVYAGGSLAALALDGELRRGSGDKVGLPDLMRALYAEYAAPGRSYTLEDLERVARQISGVDVGPVLARIVESAGLIDAAPLYRTLGLRLDEFFEEQFLTLDPAAGPAEVARRQAVL